MKKTLKCFCPIFHAQTFANLKNYRFQSLFRVKYNLCESFLFVERTILEYPPVIESISGDSGDFLAPGDRIHQINGISTIGLTNEQVLNILMCHRDENAVIEIEYSLPDYCKRKIEN